MASSYQNSLIDMLILKEENTALKFLKGTVKMFVLEASKYESVRYTKNQHDIEKRTRKTNLN
jgi:hypothetical protein